MRLGYALVALRPGSAKSEDDSRYRTIKRQTYYLVDLKRKKL